MIAALEFSHPWFLVLLSALLLLPLASRRSLAGFGRSQRVACTVVRAVLVAMIVLALAGMRALLPSSDVAVIFAVDASASISPEAAKAARKFVSSALHAQRGGDHAGVVGFGKDAEVWQAPAEQAALAEWPLVADPERGTRSAERGKDAA